MKIRKFTFVLILPMAVVVLMSFYSPRNNTEATIGRDVCTKYVDSLLLLDSSMISYSEHIQPIWNKYCTRCHHKDSEEVSVSLTGEYSYHDLMYGRHIKPFDSRKSYVYRVTRGPIPNMPPQTAADTFKMNKAEVELLKLWIEQGAVNN